MKSPAWMQIKKISHQDGTVLIEAYIKRNWALWKFLWRHVRSPWYLMPYTAYKVTRYWWNVGRDV